MSLINSLLTSIFGGNKSQRDIKDIIPLVEKINKRFDELKELSNNHLREESQKLKTILADSIKSLEEEISVLKNSVEDENTNIAEKESQYERIKQLNKKINKILKIKKLM